MVKKKVSKKVKIQRGKSKITVPNEFGGKDQLHAFRADNDLSQLLEKLEDKSDFIRKALWKALTGDGIVTCPKCHGLGVIHLK